LGRKKINKKVGDQMDEEKREQEPNEPLCAVFDMPVTTTADEASGILEQHYQRGFYTSSILEWPGAGMRVFMRRYAKSDKPKAPVGTDGLTVAERAVQFIKDNRTMSGSQLYGALVALGHKRSIQWINQKRNEAHIANL
jgi:hypothetical protein